MKVVVSDSSPLNYLALLSDFDLLRQIYGTVVIPPAVHHEVVEKGAGYPVREAGEAIIVAEALGLIGSVREKLDGLRSRGFRLADLHYEQILHEVAELPDARY